MYNRIIVIILFCYRSCFKINIKVSLIRHGKTKGNLERRYIGKTDECLSEKGINEIKILTNKKIYDDCEILFSSPLKRCLETANIIYKNQTPNIFQELSECDFGEFENKNYDELKNNSNYINWLENDGKIPFPNGEDVYKFKERCQKVFYEIILLSKQKHKKNISVICHGGTIMAILEKYSYSDKNFYDWKVENGSGYIFDFCDGKAFNIKIINGNN